MVPNPNRRGLASSATSMKLSRVLIGPPFKSRRKGPSTTEFTVKPTPLTLRPPPPDRPEGMQHDMYIVLYCSATVSRGKDKSLRFYLHGGWPVHRGPLPPTPEWARDAWKDFKINILPLRPQLKIELERDWKSVVPGRRSIILWQNEWTRHGWMSGLGVEQYLRACLADMRRIPNRSEWGIKFGAPITIRQLREDLKDRLGVYVNIKAVRLEGFGLLVSEVIFLVDRNGNFLDNEFRASAGVLSEDELVTFPFPKDIVSFPIGAWPNLYR